MLQVERSRVRADLGDRDLRLEQDLNPFSSALDFQWLSALCDQRARVFDDFIDHLIVMIWIVMKEQQLAYVCIKRQRNDAVY